MTRALAGLCGAAFLPGLLAMAAPRPVQAAAAPPRATPVSSSAGTYHPLGLTRVLDSRTPAGTYARLGPGQVVEIPLLGAGGVPGSGVGAVAVNLTVTAPSAAGFLTVWPAGTAMPVASSLSFQAGRTASGLVVATLGSGGRIAVYNARGQADLIADIEGWFGSGGGATAGLYNGLMPARLLDTRAGIGRAGAMTTGEVFDLPVAASANVPGSGAAAAVLNLTAVAPPIGGYLVLWPAGATRPVATTLSYNAGLTSSNRAIVPLGTGGKVSVFSSSGPVNLLVDLAGWFTDGAVTTAGAAFTPLRPARVLDTRTQAGGGQPVGGGAVVPVQVGGRGGVPSGAGAVILEVTAVTPPAPGFLAVFPAGNLPPLASDVSVVQGVTTANLVIARLDGSGAVAVFNAGAATHVLVDVVGWFGAMTVPGSLPSAPALTGASAASPFTAALSWTPPNSSGGTAITSYTISASPGPVLTPVIGSATSGLAAGLGCGVTYSITISAINALGSGPPSAPLSVTTACSNVIDDVPYYRQVHELSCEEAALQMALAHEGISVTQDQVLNDLVIDWRPYYRDSSGLRWGNAYSNFVGDPDGSEVLMTGYGVYYADIARVATGYGGQVLIAGENVAPATIYDALLHNHPVVVWVTFDWRYRTPGWYIAFDGRPIPYVGAVEHAVTLVGVTPDNVLVYNPWDGPQWIGRSTFEASFATYHDMAVVLN